MRASFSMLDSSGSELRRPEPRKFRFFRAVCWLFILIAFAEVVSLALSLNYRINQMREISVFAEPAIVDEAMPQEEIEEPVVLNPRGVLPVRTVDEILADTSEDTPVEVPEQTKLPDELEPLPDLPNFGDGGQLVATNEDEEISDFDKLLREARAAQVAGDMRKAMLKLEEARAQSPNHPAMLYYFGLTYEMLGNVGEARHYYTRVYEMRAYAGPYFKYATKKLEMGFSKPQDMQGKMRFGRLNVYRDPDLSKGERVVVTIPIQMSPDTIIRPEDLYIPVQFFDKANDKDIMRTRSEAPQIRWLDEPVDWSEGEELLEVTYNMPLLSSEEIIALGDIRYYGYTAKLFYKGEPMDCVASPNALLLIEQQKRKSANSFYDQSDDSSLLPPIEADPVSEDNDFLPP